MRITGGEFGGRRLKVPGRGLRPTQDRVREALFSSIAADVPGSRFLDIFAGSGAVGLGALSRGAKSVTWVESNPAIVRTLKENIRSVCSEEPANATVFSREAAQFLETYSGGQFDVIFADPPYRLVGADQRLKKALQGLGTANILADGGLLVLEQGAKEAAEELDAMTLIKKKAYGSTVLRYYRK